MKVSPSFLTSFATCPLQFKLQEIEERDSPLYAQTVYGSCIHHALDLYNKGADLETAKFAFLEAWEEPTIVGQKEPEIWTKGTSFHGLRQRGLKTLEEYHEKVRWSNRKVIASEHRFKVPFGEHELSGIVDLVEVVKDSKGKSVLRITDYKSTSRQPTKDALQYNLQFTSYYYASLQPEFWFGADDPEDGKYGPLPNAEDAYDAYFNLPREILWYHLHTNKELRAGGRSVNDFQRLYVCINEIEKTIEADVYVPNISADSCNLCPFAEDLCPATAPVYYDIIERKAKLESEVF